ncbi:MAG: glycosyltransferase [Candidatus Latescibacterota bacterium]|nr:glycosyltransferase [Candidatus Latescibacterota bacterium]
MKTVAHCVTPYLQTAGPWVYEQIGRHVRYRPIVLTQEKINIEAYPIDPLYTPKMLSQTQFFFNRLIRKLWGQYPYYTSVLRKEEARLVHAHFGYEGCRILWAKRAARIPLITSFYGADATEYARYPFWLRKYKKLFEEGDLFLVEGQGMAQRLLDLGCHGNKIKVQRLGVDLERINYKERKFDGRVRFLICAGFKEKKGIDFAIAGLARALSIHSFEYDLTLIGDGVERNRLEGMVTSLGLRKHTKFCGMLPYGQVLKQLQNHDVLLQTSVTAKNGDGEGGAPVILLDAQAAGMPIITTVHGDVPEYVVDGKSALLCQERDIKELAENIVCLIEEQQNWPKMGRIGRKHVETNYNSSLQIKDLEALYDEVS